jgi:hypothetical protein
VSDSFPVDSRPTASESLESSPASLRKFRRAPERVIPAVIGVLLAVALLYLASVGSVPAPAPPTYQVCAILSVYAHEQVWTPILIITSPPNGTAEGWSNGTLAHLGVSGPANGTALGVYSLINWSIMKAGTETEKGTGVSQGCPPTYVAGLNQSYQSPQQICYYQLASPSDAGLSVNRSVYPGCSFLGGNDVAWFNATFNTSLPCPTYCYEYLGVGNTLTTTGDSTDFTLNVPYVLSGVTHWASGPVYQTITVRYTEQGPGCFQPRVFGESSPSYGFLTWGDLLATCPTP